MSDEEREHAIECMVVALARLEGKPPGSGYYRRRAAAALDALLLEFELLPRDAKEDS